MGRPKPSRDPTLLHPAFQAKIAELEAEIERRGLPFRFYEGFRGPARQNSGYTRGTSKARWGQSWHNYGVAADFVGRVDGRWSWGNGLPWQGYGNAVERVGLSWSGRWVRFRELVHCQFPQWSLKQLRLAAQVETADMGSESWLRYVSHWWAAMEGYGPGVACRQRLLHAIGEDPGEVDGHDGPRTREATLAVLDGDLGHQHLATVRAEILSRVAYKQCGAVA